MSPQFDNYAKDYEGIIDGVLGPTGFDYSYFVTAKLIKLRGLYPTLCDAPMNFLDYGCGTGSLCREFHKFFPKAHYFGVDVSEPMLKEAQTKYQSRGTFNAINSEEWKKRSYDIIFAGGVFHHIPHNEHKGILNEIKALLHTSGKLVIWELNPINPITRSIVKNSVLDKGAVLVPSGNMKDLLSDMKLASVKVIYTSFFPGFLRFLVPLESFLEWLPLGGHYMAIGENLGSEKPS